MYGPNIVLFESYNSSRQLSQDRPPQGSYSYAWVFPGRIAFVDGGTV